MNDPRYITFRATDDGRDILLETTGEETVRYCGTRPVDPGPVSDISVMPDFVFVGTLDNIRFTSGAGLLMNRTDGGDEVDFKSYVPETTYFSARLKENTANADRSISHTPQRVFSDENMTRDPNFSIFAFRAAGNLPVQSNDPRLVVGQTLLMQYSQNTITVHDFNYVPGATQGERDAYEAALVEFNDCLATGGVEGELKDPDDLPVDPGSNATQTERDAYVAALEDFVSGEAGAPAKVGPVGSGGTEPPAVVKFELGIFDANSWAFKWHAGGDESLRALWNSAPRVKDGNSTRAAPRTFNSGDENIYVFDFTVPSLENMGIDRNVQFSQYIDADAGVGGFSNIQVVTSDDTSLESTDPIFTEGNVIRVQAISSSRLKVVAVNPKSGVTQAQYDAYVAELKAFAQALADDFTDSEGQSSSLVLATESEAVRERILSSLRMREGDCLYDSTAGFNGETLLGVSSPLIYTALLRAHLQALPFITSVENIDATFNDVDRLASVTFTAVTVLGDAVPVTFEV